MKALPSGLGWSKCGRVTIIARFPKLKITLVCKFSGQGRWDHKNNTSRKVTHLADEVYNWPQGRL